MWIEAVLHSKLSSSMMQSMSSKKKRSQGKVKELKGKWRKGEKNWSNLENCEEKMGIDKEKQRLWPKLKECLLPDPLENQAAHMGPPYPKLLHLIISLFTVLCWIPQESTGFMLISIRAKDLDPCSLSSWGWEMWTRQLSPGKKEGAPRAAWKLQPGACRDNTPHLSAGDMCQVQGCKWTGEAGKASRC